MCIALTFVHLNAHLAVSPLELPLLRYMCLCGHISVECEVPQPTATCMTPSSHLYHCNVSQYTKLSSPTQIREGCACHADAFTLVRWQSCRLSIHVRATPPQWLELKPSGTGLRMTHRHTCQQCPLAAPLQLVILQYTNSFIWCLDQHSLLRICVPCVDSGKCSSSKTRSEENVVVSAIVPALAACVISG